MAVKFFNQKLSAWSWFNRRLAARSWFDPIAIQATPTVTPTFNPSWAIGSNVVVQAGLGL